MALANYSDLKNSVIKWSHRDDLDLLIDDFILLAENEMRANDDAPLEMRLSEITVVIPMVTTTTFLDLPTDYDQARSLRVAFSNNSNRLVYKTPANLHRRQGTGTPFFYTISGNKLEFDIKPDTAYDVTLQYKAMFTALTSVNSTNEVLTKYPNIYLYGCLKHAFIYAVDNDQAAKYGLLFLEAIKAANNTEDLGRFGDSPEQGIGWAP